MKGILQAFDDYTMVVLAGNCQELVFKHAVSTIIPNCRVELPIIPAE